MAKEVPEDVEQPMSWVESGQSMLKLNIRHLWLCGAWPLPGSRLYLAYAILGLLLGAQNAIETGAALYFARGDMQQTTLLLTGGVTKASGTVKLVVVMRSQRQYHALARRVEWLMSLQRDVVQEDPASSAVLQSAHRRAYRITLGMLLMMVAQYVVWYPMPLYVDPRARRLPFAQHAWDNNTHYYELSYFLQCASSVRSTQLSWSLDLFFMSVMLLVSAQLEILARRINSLKTDDCEGELGKVAEKEKSVLAYSGDKMYENLCLCIETHQEILSFVKYLESTMSSVAMIQFCTSVLLVCVTLFQATYSTDSSTVLKCALFLPMPGTQVFLYCWAAHKVTEQAEAVSLSAYSSSWVGTSRRVKQALRIIISRAQKPLVLTAGRIYPIDREAFVSLVNASYSYYALLASMSKHE